MKLPPMRDAAFFTGLALAFLLLAAAGFALVFLLLSPQTAAALAELPRHSWWFVYAEGSAKDIAAPVWVLGATIGASLLGALAALRARLLYLRSSSPVVLFFAIFLFTICLEGLRGPAALFIVTDRSMTAAIVLSRAVYAGRFAGWLSLLVASLYALQMKYARYPVLVGVLVLVCFAIAAYLPLDRTVFLSPFLFKLGDEQGTWFAEAALGVLVAASLVAAGITRGQRGNYVLAGAFALLFFGRELTAFSAGVWETVSGFMLLSGGVVLFLIAARRLYGEPEKA